MIVPTKCDCCGLEYDKFKTGLSFGDVRTMMCVGDPNSETWCQKRRNSVLGFWREIKLKMWGEHLEMCDSADILESDFVEEY